MGFIYYCISATAWSSHFKAKFIDLTYNLIMFYVLDKISLQIIILAPNVFFLSWYIYVNRPQPTYKFYAFMKMCWQPQD